MDVKKLNNAAKTYAVMKNNATYCEFYDIAKAEAYRLHVVEITRNGYGDDSNALETFDDTFMELAAKIETLDNFAHHFSRALRHDRLDFFDKMRRYRNRYEFTINNDLAESAPTLTLVSPDNTEEDAMYNPRQRESDQRQLIAQLCDPTQVDSVTTLIVTNFSQYPSVTALAKALGLHHEVVKRKIRKLSSRYDANRFGDINEYLAV